MVLQKLQIGPNLPVITNIVLDTMSEDGEIVRFFTIII